MNKYYGLLKVGNKKIGNDTIIFNMCAATDCPSRKLGLCQLKNPDDCYALQPERQYPRVLAYRRRQSVCWYMTGFSYELSITSSLHNIKFVRYNESGDFETQHDVEKLKDLAKFYSWLQFYGYTARKDLSFKNLPTNLSICGSGWRRGNMNNYLVVDKYDPDYKGGYKCNKDCRACDLCKYPRGITIQSELVR